jgi:hypothetical protein
MVSTKRTPSGTLALALALALALGLGLGLAASGSAAASGVPALDKALLHAPPRK